jgi:hypothetical protein
VELTTIVTPDTILRWYGERVAKKFDRAVQIECAWQLSTWIQLVSNHKLSKCGGRSRELARRDTSHEFEIVTSAHRLR